MCTPYLREPKKGEVETCVLFPDILGFEQYVEIERKLTAEYSAREALSTCSIQGTKLRHIIPEDQAERFTRPDVLTILGQLNITQKPSAVEVAA